jgi:hypothetical protein
MNKQRKTSNILNVFQYDEATGIIGLNGVPVSGYGLYLHTNINDGSVGIDSSSSINALYLLKSGTKQFEISYDTSGVDKIFRLLPYQSGSFFQIGNPSNAGANYVFISEPTYGNVLIGPGIGNGTGNLTGATAATHKIQFNGAVFANSSIQATSFKITGGSSTGFLKADGTVDTVSYLSGNQTITVSGDASGSGTTSINLTLGNSGVTAGIYGSSTLVPVITVDVKGRITSVSTASISGALTFTGDVTGTGTTGSSTSLTLANSGVTAGTYTKVTVDSKGRVTVGASATTSDISEGTNLYYTDARVLAYLGANNYATQSYVGTQIANLIGAAPTTLDTLNELATALGNDPSFATTITTSIGTKVPQTRTITINGTSYDLSANRSWTINSMVYPSAGIALSTGTAWGTSITDNSSNWNTAYGWGNHASAGYLTSATAATIYASLTGSYANPSWITSLAYSKITGVPAFLTSYTETDPYRVTAVAVSGTSTKTITITRADASTVTTTWTDYDTDTNTYVTSAGFSGGTLTLTRNDSGTVSVSLDGRYALSSHNQAWSTITSTPTTLSGYGISDGLYSTTSDFTTAGTGWYRVATTSGDGRGYYYIEVYTTGGNHNPAYLRIEAMGDWGNDKLIAAYTDLGFPASAVRITRSSTTTFIEVNFTTTILGASARVVRLGFNSGASVLSGALSAGGNTVQETLSITSKINTASLSINGNAVLHAGNYNSYSPTLTGGGASGTWGISITGNAATVGGYSVSGTVGANTVVIRDVNNYVYFNYINSNVSETENPTINSFYTSNGDGWLRKSSLAHVRNQLGNYGGWITGYTETDTLATVTGRGATTSTETTYYGGLRTRKSQTAGNYTTAALWTESYDNTATGIAFHISGVKGTFLEMRTNQVLYWDGNTVYHSGNLTNLNQLTNGPGYITSSSLSSYLPLSGGTMTGIISFSNVTGNKIDFYYTGDDRYGIQVQSSELRIHSGAQGASTGGITLGKSTGSTFTENLRVRNDGLIVMSQAPSGATLMLGNVDYARVYNDTARYSLVINAAYYPHLYINATSSASNTNHGAVISMSGVLSAGGYRRWGMGIPNTDPAALSWGYYDNNTNPHYGVGGTLGYTATGAMMWLNTGGTLQVTGSMRAPIFYDSDDTSYYLDPNSTSRLYLVNAPQGYISNSNPWNTANSAYFPNGITTAGSDNWIYGHTYVGNAPANGAGHEFWSNGSSYHRSNVGTNSHGATARWLELQSASGNFIPYSFESEYGNHSWGVVARFRINQVGADRPSIQFSAAGGDDRWNIGYCTGSDWNFRITQNQAYRNDNSTQDGWGTERFKIDTSGNISAGGSITSSTYLYANGVRIGDMWGGYGIYRNGGNMVFGTEGTNWVFSSQANTRAYFASGDGNLWMQWGGWLSDLLAAKVNTSSVSGLSVNYANYASYLPTAYAGGVQTNPQVYFNNGIGLKAAMTGSWSTWSDTLWVNGYAGGDVKWMCALHFLRNSQPRMAISAQQHDSGSYGSYYEVITAWNIASQSVSYASSAGGVSWGNVSSKPAGWLDTTNLIADNTPGDVINWVPSGFYQNYAGAGNPTGTWFNYINVRHSNPGNAHGFQIGMSYYDSTLWFRSYQGSGGSNGWNQAFTTSGGSLSGKLQINASWGGTNPERFTIRGSYPSITLRSTNHDMNWLIHNDSNISFYSASGVDSDSWGRRMYIDTSGNVNASGDITAYSDARVKTNIKTIENALEKTLALRGVSYNRTDNQDPNTKIGVIAQETLPILPEVVNQNNDGMYNVSYGNITALLIEAIKEQQKQIEELQNKLDNVLSSR